MNQVVLSIKQLFFKKKKITHFEDLLLFTHNYCAKESGQLIIKYAQKRLGKIHYNLSKTDVNYAQELIDCQAKIHVELISDIGYLLSKLTQLPLNEQSKIKHLVQQTHQKYIDTCPAKYKVSNYLVDSHFTKKQTELRKLAKETGNFLFKLLPMTDNLRKSNVTIFQSQIRLIYIQYLQDLSKRAKVKEITQILQNQ